MKIAAAQTKPHDGDIELNLQQHEQIVESAAKSQAKLIVFPEMSLTGYQRESAHLLAFELNDSRLNKLKLLSKQHNIVVIAGAPIIINSKVHIGSFILKPDGEDLIYTKQYLHDGEEKYFQPNFNFNPVFHLENEIVSLAICADIAHPDHPQKAYQNNATLYLASIFYTPAGIIEAYQQLGSYSKKYGMNIVMSNYAGISYRFDAAGKSAYWDKQGDLTRALGQEEGLLVVEI